MTATALKFDEANLEAALTKVMNFLKEPAGSIDELRGIQAAAEWIGEILRDANRECDRLITAQGARDLADELLSTPVESWESERLRDAFMSEVKRRAVDHERAVNSKP